jgi:copper(I)-binding protein
MKSAIWISACLFLAACSGTAPEEPLSFEEAWVRAMPPGSMMTAGFGRLVNNGDQELEIIAYTSPQFNDVSLHQTIVVDGLSRMKAVPVLKIPAGSDFELAPGGFHLMFMSPANALEDVLSIRIELADGGQFSFELPVERR